MPGTIWHVCCHPTRPIGYAATYSVSLLSYETADRVPLFTREYLLEIDLAEARVTRHWSSGANFPIHLNSDIFVHIDEQGREFLYVSTGGSGTVVEVELRNFRESRVLEVLPPLLVRVANTRTAIRDIWEAAARAPLNVRTDQVVQTLEVTRGSVFDGVYATRPSPDGKYLVVGHRGYNWIGVYDRCSFERVWERSLPRHEGGHLGMHHAAVQPIAAR
jgi:hypothetical protein